MVFALPLCDFPSLLFTSTVLLHIFFCFTHPLHHLHLCFYPTLPLPPFKSLFPHETCSHSLDYISSWLCAIYFPTVTLTIELLYAGNNIEHGAILLAVRPLMIGHRKTSHIFCKYEPPRE